MRTYRRTYACERMLNITSHQRDANYNHDEIPPYTSQNGHHKQINKQQVLVRMQRKGNPGTLLVGMQTGVATVENSMEFPQKTKNGTAFWPGNSTAGIMTKESWNTTSKKPVHSNFHSSTIYNSQVMSMPISKWMHQKLWYIFTIKYYIAERK